MLTSLFVPGDRPDRFAKAVDSGADVVVSDLADAVPAQRKDAAPDAAAEFCARLTRVPVHVRINAVHTAESEADLAPWPCRPAWPDCGCPKWSRPMTCRRWRRRPTASSCTA